MSGPGAVSGHRGSLLAVLDAYLVGMPVERLEALFSTIPPRKLAEVVSFIDRSGLIRAYHAEQRAAKTASAGGRLGRAPTLTGLRRRK